MRAIRFLLRVTGTWLLAAAFVALVIDGTYSIAGGVLMTTPLAATLDGISAGLADAVRGAAPGWLPRDALEGLLDAPVSAILAASGALLVFLGRVPRRHRLSRPDYA